MSGPVPYKMEIGVEVWRMPPRTRKGASYSTNDLKECRDICKWLNSLRIINRDGASFRNHPFDYTPRAHLGVKPGPCIMISGQFTVWRANPGDYIVLLPEGFSRRIDIVERTDFLTGFAKA